MPTPNVEHQAEADHVDCHPLVPRQPQYSFGPEKMARVGVALTVLPNGE